MLTRSSVFDRILQHDAINFALTNRIPRRLATLCMGWFSQIEHPLVRDLSIATWQLFAGGLDLREARKSRFTSLHDCFIRELKPGARPIDERPEMIVSPCDAIVGASGRMAGSEVFQCKDSGYTLEQLFRDPAMVERYRGGSYVTLRLTSSMYHRFHAPYAGRVREVIYFSGDTWNVNPIALRRVERLFCRNERAVLGMSLAGSPESIVLVAVAAILVASIHFTFIDVALNLRYRGPNRIGCDASFQKGDELGHFQHGSTIIVFGTPGLALCDHVRQGAHIQMGTSLFRQPFSSQSHCTGPTSQDVGRSVNSI